MAYDVSSLLMHSEDVPESARAALRSARAAAPDEREAYLRTAASELFWKTPLACDEARELVGLPVGSCQ